METNQKAVTIGGSFIIKESNPNDIFTPEDFTEEHKMMKESVIEFVDREIVPKKQRFEQKDYKLTSHKIGEVHDGAATMDWMELWSISWFKN